jgi:surface protein
LFAGYVVPCTYNQDYAREWEKITINCIDNLGVLEYRQQTDEHTWDELKAASQMRTFKYLIDLMHLRDTTYIIPNLPQQQASDTQTIWVETGFERVVNSDSTITYRIVESEVRELDSDTAVTTTNKRVGDTPLTVTYIQSEEIVIHNGLPYYKQYAYVTVNGELVNTGDWIYGDLATDDMPTVVDTINVLDGWTYGAILQPFEYYEHFRVDKEMSDGSIARGDTDTIGDRIPEYPQTTTRGSYYEFRRGDAHDLYHDDNNNKNYYKNYAWIVMEIDNETVEYKTGDWVVGNRYTPSYQISGYMDSDTMPTAYLRVNGDSVTPEFTYTPDVFDHTTYYYEFNNLPQRINNIHVATQHTPIYGPNYEIYYKHDGLSSISIGSLDTTYMTNMSQMFSTNIDASIYNDTLSDIDLTYLDTIAATDMSEMFKNCDNITSLDVSGFDTSNVTNMSEMFRDCQSLTSLDLSNFDTSNVTNMSLMFNHCESLSSIDVSSFNTSNVTSMESMFNRCESLSSIDVSSFDTSNVWWMNLMFAGCTSLTSLDISTFDTSNVEVMNGLIQNCPNLTTVNISNLNTSKWWDYNVNRWFMNCDALTSLTMDNTSDDTFAYITNETRLNHNCTIYRDNVTYVYSADDETWIPQS